MHGDVIAILIKMNLSAIFWLFYLKKKTFFFDFFKLNSFQLFENTSAILLVIFSLNKYHVSYLNMQILFKSSLNVGGLNKYLYIYFFVVIFCINTSKLMCIYQFLNFIPMLALNTFENQLI